MRTRCGAICGLMLLVTGPTTRAAAASGETPLDALAAGLNGAGCEYRDAATQRLLMVTEARSLPDNGRGVARVSLKGEVQRLDRIGSDERAPRVFGNRLVRVVARDFGPIDACDGSECEGSRQRAVLDITLGARRTSVAVDVHCGA